MSKFSDARRENLGRRVLRLTFRAGKDGGAAKKGPRDLGHRQCMGRVAGAARIGAIRECIEGVHRHAG